MCFICDTIGIHPIQLRSGEPKIKDWIDDEDSEVYQPVQNKIRTNLTYYLGNSIRYASLRKAADTLFERDYKNKKQIFVPEVFFSKDPSMIYHEKQKLEKLLASRKDDDMTEEDVKKWRCRLNTIEGEKIEKNLYDTLKRYFLSHPDQQVLVLHGFEILDLFASENNKKVIQHWENDVIVVNLTYGYILNIEAKSSLNGKSLLKAKEQLENTRKILEKWFGADLKPGWRFISAIYCERDDKTNKNCKEKMDFIFTSEEDLIVKLENIHKECQKSFKLDHVEANELDYKSFELLAKYLLFFATRGPAPLSSSIDMRIKEGLEKCGCAKNIVFWNWTPLQKSLLDADIQRVIMTSHCLVHRKNPHSFQEGLDVSKRRAFSYICFTLS